MQHKLARSVKCFVLQKQCCDSSHWRHWHVECPGETMYGRRQVLNVSYSLITSSKIILYLQHVILHCFGMCVFPCFIFFPPFSPLLYLGCVHRNFTVLSIGHTMLNSTCLRTNDRVGSGWNKQWFFRTAPCVKGVTWELQSCCSWCRHRVCVSRQGRMYTDGVQSLQWTVMDLYWHTYLFTGWLCII